MFKGRGRCVEVDTSVDRSSVYDLVREQLAEYTDASLLDQPLSEQSEMLLGLRPYSK